MTQQKLLKLRKSLTLFHLKGHYTRIDGGKIQFFHLSVEGERLFIMQYTFEPIHVQSFHLNLLVWKKNIPRLYFKLQTFGQRGAVFYWHFSFVDLLVVNKAQKGFAYFLLSFLNAYEKQSYIPVKLGGKISRRTKHEQDF